MISWINAHNLLALLAIISAGHLAGRISIKGFSLGSSGILFVALLAGHLGVSITPVFKTMGLAFFIYAIGLEAGPKFFSFLKREGVVFNLLAIAAVSAGAVLTAACILLAGINKSIAIGIFSGALTSTPGLAAAQEAVPSDMVSIGYGLAYPIGVLLVILYIKMLPGLLKTDPDQEAVREKDRSRTDPVLNRFILVKNPAVNGKSLNTIGLPDMTGAIVSRLFRNGEMSAPHKDTILQDRDIVRIVGTAAALDAAETILGEKTEIELPRSTIEAQQFIITNKDLVGKSIAEINVAARYNATITRIRRSGMELPASSSQRLEWGDRILVVGDSSVMAVLKKIFGNDMKEAYSGNIYSILMGIALGIIIGMIPFSIGRVIHVKLGLTGGILAAGLILSSRPKLGLFIWRAPSSIISFIRELGLALFLTAVGTSSGSTLLEVLRTQGLPLAAMSVCITLAPMIVITWLAHRKLNIRLLPLSGVLTGGMTSTPGLAAASALSDSHTPMMMYASVYPVSMIFMIIWVKILALL